MPRAKTYAAGANDERTAILAKVRRMIRQAVLVQTREDLEMLAKWIGKRDERYNKRKGGLGK